MIGPIPESNGFNAVEVFVDKYTKHVHFEPTYLTLNADGFTKMFTNTIIKNHGIPNTVISDRGPQTVSKYWNEICKNLGITKHLSTAYHPQTDGQTEQMNRELEVYLRIFISYLKGYRL